MAFILTVVAVFILLVASEYWWRTHHAHSELSRKFVHITVGSFVAFWPLFLGWGEIQLLSIAFFAVVSLSKYLHVFRAIHSVQRPTWGELYFALAVGSVTLITHNKWIYMAAILQMSLADGLAAIVGVRYGMRGAYKVFGHTKTVIGSVTFLVVAVLILVVYQHMSGVRISSFDIVSLAVFATFIENCGIAGLDNLLVPVVVAVALRLLS